MTDRFRRMILLPVPRLRPARQGSLCLLFFLCGGFTASERIWADEPRSAEIFEKSVRPLFISTCFKCHGGEKVSGGLRVDSREALLAGGESGPALVPGNPDDSLMIHVVKRHDDVSAMPPDKPLDTGDVEGLVSWIREGATWPSAAKVESKRHWAFEAVTDPDLPSGERGIAVGEENSIDAFLAPMMAAQGIAPNPPAERRDLLRRVTLDLTGLPPTYEEVEDFKKDTRSDAFAREVDRLLASPAYGERWGKHWLDVARYADTSGDNTDRPLPYAWKYRNWVIDAFRRDLPYDEFLRDQVAGDIRAEKGSPDEYADHVVATGYLAIARRFDHDSDKFMHLTFEDAIDTLGKSTLGLTLGCARCHSHKYDPISADDYYALFGILASSKFSFSGCEAKPKPRDLVSVLPPDQRREAERRHEEGLSKYDQTIKELTERLTSGATELMNACAKSSTRLMEGTIADASTATNDSKSIVVEHVAVQPGHTLLLSIDRHGNHGADSTRVDMKIESTDGSSSTWDLLDVMDDFTSGNPHVAKDERTGVWCFLDARQGWRLLDELIERHSGQAGLHVWRNGDTPSVFINASEEPIKVWTELAPRSVFLHPGPEGPVAVGWVSPMAGTVRVSLSMVDAHAGGDGVDWRLDVVATDIMPELNRQQSIISETINAKKQRDDWMVRSPNTEVAYAVVEATPANARLQERGDPEKLGNEVPRRWLEMFGGMPVTSGSGRSELAQWLTARDNPLTYRVIVNRLWLHHFGAGIVTTPNDFGTRGAAPSHPDLLDWLTGEMLRRDASIKSMHRLILASAAYQRSSFAPQSTTALEVDPMDASRWRYTRRRLSAEEIRDSLLEASGDLDRSMGAAHPFPASETWRYTQHQPFADNYDTHRRSIYMMILRNRRHPFLGLFDGADPNASTPLRPVTTVPTQALYFMNDSFLHQSAEHLAQRVGDLPTERRLDRMFALVLQRLPSDDERKLLSPFRESARTETKDGDDGWSAVARLLLSSNEFLYVD